MTSLTRSSEIIRNLNVIRSKGWDAIIAGSVIADSYHGKHIAPNQSIDIFIKSKKKSNQMSRNDTTSYTTKDWIHYWYKMFNMKDFDTIKCLGDHKRFRQFNSHIEAVWELETYGKSYKIIIVDKDPRKYVDENFDFGIAMAYCDGTKMHFTNEFMQDTLNKTITLYEKNLTPTQIMYAKSEHAKKLAQKYPGWTFNL